MEVNEMLLKIKDMIQKDLQKHHETMSENTTITFNPDTNEFMAFRSDLVTPDKHNLVISKWLNGEWKDYLD